MGAVIYLIKFELAETATMVSRYLYGCLAPTSVPFGQGLFAVKENEIGEGLAIIVAHEEVPIYHTENLSYYLRQIGILLSGMVPQTELDQVGQFIQLHDRCEVNDIVPPSLLNYRITEQQAIEQGFFTAGPKL